MMYERMTVSKWFIDVMSGLWLIRESFICESDYCGVSFLLYFKKTEWHVEKSLKVLTQIKTYEVNQPF